jgi:hypothetical protein
MRNNKGQFIKNHEPLYHGGAKKGVKFSEHHKKQISLSLTGKKVSNETKEKQRQAKLGKKLSIQHRKNISKSNVGKKCHFWRGGLTKKNARIRNSIDFKLWRESVFERDKWMCQACGQFGKRLNAHHIQNFSQYPELRFNTDNGITFCLSCHRRFHKLFGRKDNNLQQILKFINNKYDWAK